MKSAFSKKLEANPKIRERFEENVRLFRGAASEDVEHIRKSEILIYINPLTGKTKQFRVEE